MSNITLINSNKINEARVDLALRVSAAPLFDRVVITTGVVCVADSVAGMVMPSQPRISDDLRPDSAIAPLCEKQLGGASVAEGEIKGHQIVAGTTTHRMSTRGKAATKFSTRLGRSSCSPPV